jgi:hypothetical protein
MISTANVLSVQPTQTVVFLYSLLFLLLFTVRCHVC